MEPDTTSPALPVLELDAIRADCLRRLERGRDDRRDPMHVGTLASVGHDGRPHARTVVLRQVAAELSAIAFHTDARSEKYTELLAEPACALTFYAPEPGIQIRIEGEAVLHVADAVAARAWESATRSARDCYRIEPAPGSLLSRPEVARLVADDTQAFAHFCRAEVLVQRLEWLYLSAGGHRRARFLRQGTQWSAHWLAP